MPGCAGAPRVWRASPSRASGPTEPSATSGWSRCSRRHLLLSFMRQGTEGFFEVGTHHLEVADVDASTEEFSQQGLGGVAEELHSVVRDGELGDREPRKVRLG